MANEKFSAFAVGNEFQIGDQPVGLRASVNTIFSFPGTGIKDASGNYLFKYLSAGSAAINYLQFSNALTLNPVSLAANGTDGNIDINIVPKGTGNVIVPTPTVPFAAATKSYVDGIGLIGQYFIGVRAASITNLNAVYVNGNAGIGATLTTIAFGAAVIDGYSLAVNDLVLFKDQTLQFQNGVYYLSSNGDISHPAIFTRSSLFDTAAKIKLGYTISVVSGTENQQSEWQLNSVVGSVGIDPITFQLLNSIEAPLTYFSAVRATTTTNLSATYANGTNGIGATLTMNSVGAAVLDGVTLALNDPVLIQNQTSTFQNGIYTLTTLGTGLVNAVYTRSVFFNTPLDMKFGFTISVVSGINNSSNIYQLNSVVTTIGTDAITFQTAIISTVVPSVDQTVPRYSGTSGKSIQTSNVKISNADALTVGNGSTSLPSLSFNANTGHGLSYGSATQVNFSIAGTQTLSWSTQDALNLLGTTSRSALYINNTITAASGTLTGAFIQSPITPTGSLTGAFQLEAAGVTLGGTAQTITNCATVYINGAMGAGTNTVSNGPYALWITGTGNSYFDASGTLTITGTNATNKFKITNLATSNAFNVDTVNMALSTTATLEVDNTVGIGGAPSGSDALAITRATTHSGISCTNTITPASTTGFGIFVQSPITVSGAATSIAELSLAGVTVGGSGQTITNLATLYVSSAMSGGSNTVTNGPYSFWIGAGASRLTGTVQFDSNFYQGAVPSTTVAYSNQLAISGITLLAGIQSLSNLTATTGVTDMNQILVSSYTSAFGAVVANATNNAGVHIIGQTVTGSGGGTITNVASLYVESAPTVSGFTGTVTNGPYAIYSAAGANRFNGTVTINNNLTMTGTLSTGTIDGGSSTG